MLLLRRRGRCGAIWGIYANFSVCAQYNDWTLATYSAIMHFTGAFASLPASYFTQHFGRTRCARAQEHFLQSS